jgi:cytochrome c oxidase subunit 4
VSSSTTNFKRLYLLTFAGLLGLTALTVGIGFIDLGVFNTVIAVVLAATKASLIAMFFMHALYDSRLVRVVLAAGVIWVAILMSLTLADYTTRQFMTYPANQGQMVQP